MKALFIIIVVFLSFFITSFDLVDVGNVTVGVISMDIPAHLQSTARNILVKGAVNMITFGGNVEFSDRNVTVVGGYSPLFRRIRGLDSNIQAAARSNDDGLHIIIGIPALPPESY